MKKIFLSFALLVTSTGMLAAQQKTPPAKQNPLTTNTGVPVGDNQNSITVGETGPVLLEDIDLVEKLASFDRERIPERVVHARGVGVHGVFQTYGDYSNLTKAAFLDKKGKETPVFVRFSVVIPPKGGGEMVRDPRGFAVKFYTEQGNYDLVGNNLPVFFIRDAIKFPDLIHALKPSPVTNRQEPARFFDFFTFVPESTHMFTLLYSDQGIPANYRQMNGSGVHAFKWVNAKGEVHYVKYTWTTQQGVKNMTATEAKRVASLDPQNPQNATDDMYENVRKGNFPSWELSVQVLKPEDLDKFEFNPLDATKIWPEKLVPSMKIGKMTLNRMPDNFFQETEQSAFSPGDLVPGIEPSEDRLLQGRLFSYFDTQRYRVGTNFQQLPINRPIVAVNTNNQDGFSSIRPVNTDVNYQPNNPNVKNLETPADQATPMKLSGVTQQRRISKTDDFTQAGQQYLAYTEQERANLISNLAGDLTQVPDKKIQLKMVSHFYKANVEYGTRLATALNLKIGDVIALADKL